MPIEKLRPSFTFTQERLNELKAVVPEAFADGKINWDVLREALGEHLEEESQEHFGLTWPGKREARRLASLPSKGTLVPQPGEGVNEEDSHNIFIEGDNLEVLKLLQKSYGGKIKIIYIDPPYNTGKDRIYQDKFEDIIENYLSKIGELGQQGELLTTNAKTDGRFHSNWLNFMYPRLLLARQLLRQDGIIFVSIDDGEVNNLKLMMNEIFGEGNFFAQIVWKNVYGGGAKSKYVVSQHEYILCYFRDMQSVDVIDLPPDPEARKRYTEKDEKYPVRGPYFTQPLATTSMDTRPNLRFPIYWNGNEIWPEKQWQWSKERVEKALANNELVIRNDSGKWSVRYKQYLRDEQGNERSSKLNSILSGPWSQEGTSEIEELFGDGKTFAFPKPSRLIQHLISVAWHDPSAIILDFFAGSCSTAQAVYQLNRDHHLNNRFILVQLPEMNEDSSYASVAELGKERIRRVIKKMKSNEGKQYELETLKTSEDLGFKVYKLTRSNFKEWINGRTGEIGKLQDLFNQFESPLLSGWLEDDLLTEIQLLQGFPLDSQITTLSSMTHNKIQVIRSEFYAHHLYICLDKVIHDSTIVALHIRPEDVFICLDNALTDEAKLRLSDRCNLKVI